MSVQPVVEKPVQPAVDKAAMGGVLLELKDTMRDFTLKWEKLVGLCTVIEFLGMILDTLRMEPRLPEEKAAECLTKRKKYKTRELLSLIGKLAHTCRIFLRTG